MFIEITKRPIGFAPQPSDFRALGPCLENALKKSLVESRIVFDHLPATTITDGL